MDYSWIDQGFVHTPLGREFDTLKALYLSMDTACLEAGRIPPGGVAA